MYQLLHLGQWSTVHIVGYTCATQPNVTTKQIARLVDLFVTADYFGGDPLK
jgi:hypothetical protein